MRLNRLTWFSSTYITCIPDSLFGPSGADPRVVQPLGQSPLFCRIQVAKAQELLRPGCWTLAAENYGFGWESQPNGLILLIQPKGLHTAALSLPAREEDSLKERGESEAERGTVGGSWTGPICETQRVIFLKEPAAWAHL